MDQVQKLELEHSNFIPSPPTTIFSLFRFFTSSPFLSLRFLGAERGSTFLQL